VSILLFRATRQLLRDAHARMMVVFFAILYALGSMVLGGMLIITRMPGGYSAMVLWGNALGQGGWNYPGLLVVAPWGIVTLPFLATWGMVFVSIGVGVGISVGLLIAVRLVRDRRRAARAPGSVASVAGLTPAMIALVTLGACCSTTAAATAGVGLVAQASGTTVNSLLVNNWYLDVFQAVVVLIALLAQEMLLEVYGGLFGLRDSVVEPTPAPTASRSARMVGGVLRAALLVAGITWALAVLAEWTTVAPANAGAGLWFQWIAQHLIPAGLAIVAALCPRVVAGWLERVPHRIDVGIRVLLGVAGASLALWTPGQLAFSGAPGFLNELFAVGGLSGAFAPVTPVFAPGAALYLRWAFQYLLLGGFALAVAMRPRGVARPLRWSAGASPPPFDANVPGPGELRFPAIEASVIRNDSAALGSGVRPP
jgi:hypothetical protein